MATVTTRSYHVATADGGPGTRVDGVIAMAWEDDILRLDGDDGPLFMAPIRQIAYVKQVEPKTQSLNPLTGQIVHRELDGREIHQALLKFKRSEGLGRLGLA